MAEQSPINNLHDFCLKKGINKPTYELISTEGPAHQPNFTFIVKVANMVSTGIGRTKVKARGAAAKRALDHLLIKEAETTAEVLNDVISHPVSRTQFINPVSQLNEFCQKRKINAKYEVEHLYDSQHVCGYKTECSVNYFITRGYGPSKKLSKNDAAKQMLQLFKKSRNFSADEQDTTMIGDVSASSFEERPVRYPHPLRANQVVMGKFYNPKVLLNANWLEERDGAVQEKREEVCATGSSIESMQQFSDSPKDIFYAEEEETAISKKMLASRQDINTSQDFGDDTTISSMRNNSPIEMLEIGGTAESTIKFFDDNFDYDNTSLPYANQDFIEDVGKGCIISTTNFKLEGTYSKICDGKNSDELHLTSLEIKFPDGKSTYMPLEENCSLKDIKTFINQVQPQYKEHELLLLTPSKPT